MKAYGKLIQLLLVAGFIGKFSEGATPSIYADEVTRFCTDTVFQRRVMGQIATVSL